MAQEYINLGTVNGDDGDFVRDAFGKAQGMFSELYALTYFTDRIVSGAAVWVSGLTFDVNVDLYILNGVVLPLIVDHTNTREPIVATVTLSAADATHPRIDTIVVTESETIVVVEGTPAASPAEPTIDFETQIAITNILIPALATEPDGVSEEIIYAENAGESGEWTVTESTSGARINLGDTNNPDAGTINIRTTDVNLKDKITYTNDAPLNVADVNVLTFRLSNISTFSTPTFGPQIQIHFELAGVRASNNITLTHGIYGYDQSTTGYQTISIPTSAIAFKLSTFDTIIMNFRQDDIDYDIDNVRLVLGVTQPDGLPNTFLNLTDVVDDTYEGKEGYIPVVTNGNLVLTSVSTPLHTHLKVTVSAADLKTLGTTPVDMIPAPGAGKIIKLKSYTGKLNWGSVAFDNNIISLAYDGGATLLNHTNFLGDTATNIEGRSITDSIILENTKVILSGTDSVATGDSTVDFYLTYEIITL